jgi:hypothetical protein
MKKKKQNHKDRADAASTKQPDAAAEIRGMPKTEQTASCTPRAGQPVSCAPHTLTGRRRADVVHRRAVRRRTSRLCRAYTQVACTNVAKCCEGSARTQCNQAVVGATRMERPRRVISFTTSANTSTVAQVQTNKQTNKQTWDIFPCGVLVSLMLEHSEHNEHQLVLSWHSTSF